MSSRTVGLAASFVVTVAAAGGCRDGKDPSTSGESGGRHYTPPHLLRDDAVNCRYLPGYGCPADVTCNPPAPQEADCPEAPSDPLAAQKPGWVRIKERVGAYRGSCSFSADYFCPMPGGDAKETCETPEHQKLDCKEIAADAGAIPDGGQPGWHWIEPFSAKRAGGLCVRYAGFWCEPGGCELPAATPVDCASGAVLASATPSASAAPSSSGAVKLPEQGILNPRDARGRLIRTYGKGACFVELPFPPLGPDEVRHPGTPPPSESAPCPPIMADPAFQQCPGGLVVRDGPQCECQIAGNPPPPAREIPCPGSADSGG